MQPILDVAFTTYYIGLVPLKVAKFSKTQINLAAVIVDMQDSLLAQILQKDQLIQAQVDVLNSCARYDIPVAVLQYSSQGNTTAQIEAALENVPRKDYFWKQKNDGFSNNLFANKLRQWDVNALLFMGISASYCVQATAESALRNNYKIFTSEQLISDNSGLTASAKRWYKENGIFVQDYKQIIK